MSFNSFGHMMEDIFKIHIEQLNEGREKKIQETLSPAFLDINEEDLFFNDPIELSGSAYLAEDELILNLNMSTRVLIRCSMCNELTPLTIDIQNCYHGESLKEITGGIFDISNFVRETILLEVPISIECNNGNCPKRKEFTKYLAPSSDQSSIADGHHPFADLDWKE